MSIRCEIAQPAPFGQKTKYKDGFFEKAFMTLFSRKMEKFAAKSNRDGNSSNPQCEPQLQIFDAKSKFLFSVLSFAGYEPRLRKSDKQFKLLHLFQQHQSGDGGITVECPPGKVPVLENCETRCLVKEQVEIPFESGVATPDVNYGCG